MDIEEKIECISMLLFDFIEQRKTVSITEFCHALKEKYNLTFSIYGNKKPESSIYAYLGEISGDCIAEGLPNITTIIDFKGDVKDFYRLNEKQTLESERNKVFSFNWDEKVEYKSNDVYKSGGGGGAECKNEEGEDEEGEDADEREYRMEITRYKRNSAVRREVLKRSGGKCEKCKKAAPFLDKKNEPYLEVHHVQYLSNNGADKAENCLALCPNCHRKIHFGQQ